MDVYQKLKEDIIKGKYEPGSVFVEKDYPIFGRIM